MGRFRSAMRCTLAFGVLACGTQPEPQSDATSETSGREPPRTAPSPRAEVGELRGDLRQAEHEILAIGEADIGEEELLGLPGSQGFAVETMRGVAIADGGTSVGTPNHGSLSGGIQLPFDPTRYTRRDAKRSYATSHTLRTIQAAFTSLRRDRGVKAAVIIGDISLPRGGTFPPHVSHTSGRDIDIRLVLAKGLDRETIPFLAEQVDWDATWALVHSFLETGDVAYVFLDFQHQAHLHAAALRAGVHEEVLAQWFAWPDGYDSASIIRHEPGHRAHLHVRLGCTGQGPRCEGGQALDE
jgi:hypothetical protein